MARWENVLSESSRLLIGHAEPDATSKAEPAAADPVELDDEGIMPRAASFAGWRVPRALRWWMHRSKKIQIAG